MAGQFIQKKLPKELEVASQQQTGQFIQERLPEEGITFAEDFRTEEQKRGGIPQAAPSLLIPGQEDKTTGEQLFNVAAGVQKSLAGLPEFALQIGRKPLSRGVGLLANPIREAIGKEPLTREQELANFDRFADLGVKGADPESIAFKAAKTTTDVAQFADLGLGLFQGIKGVKHFKLIDKIKNIKNIDVKGIMKDKTLKKIWDAIKPDHFTENTKLKDIKGPGIVRETLEDVDGVRSAIPSKQGKEMIQTAFDIKLPTQADASTQLGHARSSLADEAENLKQMIIDQGNFAYNPKQVTNKIDNIEKPGALELGDATFRNLKQEALDIIERSQKNGLGLLDARKEFDAVINDKYRSIWDDVGKEPLRRVVSDIRDIMNQTLIDGAKNVDISSSLKKQSNIFGIIDNLRMKKGGKGTTAFGRFKKAHPLLVEGTKKAASAGVIGGAGLLLGQKVLDHLK